MADQKLSQLTSAATPTGDELVYVVQNGVQRRTTTRAVAELAGAAIAAAIAAHDDEADPHNGASPTFADLTLTGLLTAPHIHGNLAGEVYQHVRADGVSLTALTPYHVVGSQGDTGLALVIAARGDTVAAMPASGILPAALNSNEAGHGTVAGVITGVNTAGLTSGDPVYVGLTGGLTATRPATGLVQVVAIVGRVHASTGSLAVAVGPALPPLAYTAAYGDLSGLPGVATTSTAGLRAATSFSTITYGATVALDFASLDAQYRTISLTGNLELTTSNLANGRTLVIRLVADGSQRTLTFPTDWKFIGTKPANIAASKTAVLSITAFGTANADVVAAYAVQS